MISTAYLFIVAGLTAIMAFFDVFLFQISFFQAARNLVWIEFISLGHILFVTLIIGLILCLFIDFRLYRNKERKFS